MKLSANAYYSMWQSMAILEAQDTMREMLIADWPHLSKNDRNKIDKDLRKRANAIQSEKEGRALTTRELMTAMGKG